MGGYMILSPESLNTDLNTLEIFLKFSPSSSSFQWRNNRCHSCLRRKVIKKSYSSLFLLKEIEPCGFLYCVKTHIKYLNQADQIFRSLFSNVNKHPNISDENKENKENSDLKL